MGTCCGKIEKNQSPVENGSIPDEAKPLRPLRDAEVRRKKANKQEAAIPSENTEKLRPETDKNETVEAGNTETESLNNLQASSKIENSVIQNFELKGIDDEANPSRSQETETRPTPIVPDSEETFRNTTISEEQTDQPKENCSTNSADKTDESKLEQLASNSNQSFDDKTTSEDVDGLQETVFALDLTSGEKDKLEAEGINVDAITHVEQTSQALVSTPDLLKKLNEEHNGKEAVDLLKNEDSITKPDGEQAAKRDEDAVVAVPPPPSIPLAEKPNLNEAAKISESFAGPNIVASSSETADNSSKIESDLGALLTPNLLKKLQLQQQNGEKSEDGIAESSKIDASSSSTRLSQQEQRQSRNSFLGNFLQEGVFSSFDEQFNSMSTTFFTNPAKKIEAIAKSVRNLQPQVEAFSGGKTSTEYLYLESSLLINIDELNKIQSDDNNKTDALSHIYELLKKLDENSVF